MMMNNGASHGDMMLPGYHGGYMMPPPTMMTRQMMPPPSFNQLHQDSFIKFSFPQ